LSSLSDRSVAGPGPRLPRFVALQKRPLAIRETGGKSVRLMTILEDTIEGLAVGCAVTP